MILLRVSAQGAQGDEVLGSLLQHVEFQAGLWALLCKEQVQVQSCILNDVPLHPEAKQQLDEMVLG